VKLTYFSVSKYRSITTANKLPIKDLTVLIGPNNEGKSNVLRAFVLALEILRRYGEREWRRRDYLFSRRYRYDWEIDFPISLQSSEPKGKSTFVLGFKLEENETEDFQNTIKTSLSGELPISVEIGKEMEPEFKVRTRGRAAKALSQKSSQIAKFIGQKLDFEYIPAIRTAESAIEVVQEMLDRELVILEKNDEYLKSVSKIEELQKPVLKNISDNITKNLKEFLPNVTKVEVMISKERQFRALRRNCEINVDDGDCTTLENKGDGMKSLAALSLMRQYSASSAGEKKLILAVEEPESHLHPNAIHNLKRVIQEMSKKHQILLSTHCPLFVERQDIKANILVIGKKAVPAKNIMEIREILGVQASDNLMHAEVILIVEGESDKVALTALLSQTNKEIQKAIANSVLVIDPLFGSGKLGFKLAQYKNTIYSTHCFLDNDQAAVQAIDKAESSGLLSTSDYTLTVCKGMRESELEDLYDPEIYKNLILTNYGVMLDKQINAMSPKWSERVKEIFVLQGKKWSDSLEKKIKAEIAGIIKNSTTEVISPHRRNSFEALMNSLVLKIKKQDETPI
jgi:predicted ATP-dependent endonuclease of OLD family